MTAHLCRFDALSGLVGQAQTYEALKRAALASGRFSVFEVTTGNASLFDQLCSDPAVETWDAGYPWAGVRVRRDR